MNLHRLRSVLGKGSHHLGHIVFWRLADASVDRATLESLWRDAGLSGALLPEEPTAERALKQVVREAQVGQRDRLIRLGLEAQRHEQHQTSALQQWHRRLFCRRSQ